MVLASWWDELGRFPALALNQVFAKWLRTKTTAPSVAELLNMLRGCISTPAKPRQLSPPPVVVTAEELAARREASTRLHKKFPKFWRAPREGEQ